MKAVATILAIMLISYTYAQCEATRILNSYIAIPGFFNLYFTGQCVSQSISDTTICVKVARTNQGQVAAFSYSSPSGQPAYVTSVKQYINCELIDDTPYIEQGSDTVTVCYTIQAQLIDNFCPYTVLSGGLAVTWCGIYAYHSDSELHLRWLTCSNIGTNCFEVIHSVDGSTWNKIATVTPYQSTNSSLSNYNVTIPFNIGGQHYFAVRELDYNGNAHISEIVYVDIPYISAPQGGYDLLGRRVNDNSFMFYLPKR
jgi:hypothetical protein